MKATNPGSRRQKIILYYTLAVVLPAIFLGYMAYRGIRNDQALREKESRTRLEINSRLFFNAVDSGLVWFMNEQIADSMPAQSINQDPSILVLFAIDSSGSKKLISNQLLYLPPELLTIRHEQLNQPASLNEALRMEFVENRFSEALRFYQNKIRITDNPEEKVNILMATARLYNKMNQADRAKTIYDSIRWNYSGSLLNGQIPLGLISGLEILKINQAQGEKEEFRKNSLKSLELLLHPPSEYDKNQFELFYQSFKEIILQEDPVIDSLFRELDTQRDRNDYLIRLISGPDLFQADGITRHKSAGYEISVIPVSSAGLSAIYLSLNKSNGYQTSMVIDFPVYLKSVSNDLIQILDPDSSLYFKIEDTNGRVVFSNINKEETGYLSFTFPENLPNFKLFLSENKPGFIATLLKAGSGIYLFIFILIALLMVLGFVFIMYTLNVEFRLNKMKSEFISNVSHELKSPLTSIRMMTEMLHHNRVQTEERKSAYYATMLEEIGHLSHLIDNILDFSRIDEKSKKYDFVELDMDELLQKFLESTREMIPGPGLDMLYNRTGKTSVIRADKNAILQVFYNLVDNAIKFSGTSKRIDITLHSNEYELVFCVKDYGIGIAGKDHEKIFDRFYRGEEPQRMGIMGSGIGLTIVKKIVEEHMGKITCESKPGEGSTFCVHLPINKNTGQ